MFGRVLANMSLSYDRNVFCRARKADNEIDHEDQANSDATSNKIEHMNRRPF